jgi:hypothetical protein
MKNLQRLLAVAFLMALLNPGFGQKKEKTPQWPWEIEKIVYTSDSSGAGIFRASKKKAGVVFVKENGEVEKEVSIPGYLLEIGKWKGNILVIYTTEWDSKVDKELHAALVDSKTKAILSDKAIYQNPGNNNIETRVGNDEDGNFNYLLVRTSAAAGNHNSAYAEEAKSVATTALTAVFLSDNLEASVKQLPSVAIGGLFLYNYTNKRGEIFIVSHSGGQVVVEKFGQNGQMLQKVASPVDMYAKGQWLHKGIGRFDPATDDLLAFSIANLNSKKDNTISLFIFDLKKGKVLTNGTQELNKDYFKQLKADPEMTKSKQFKDIEDLKPDGIIYMGDKLIVCKDIKEDVPPPGPGSAARYKGLGAIISVYDRQLHLLHEFFIDKHYECFINEGRGLSYHIRNGKLLAFDNEDTGIASYGNFYYVIDPEKYTIEKKTPEWGNLMKSYPVEISTLFWFRNSIVKSHSAGDNFFGTHIDSYIQKINYE